MKGAIALIVIGGSLLVDGGMRIVLGTISGEPVLIFAGILTGLILGGYLIYRGTRRAIRVKTSQVKNNK